MNRFNARLKRLESVIAVKNETRPIGTVTVWDPSSVERARAAMRELKEDIAAGITRTSVLTSKGKRKPSWTLSEVRAIVVKPEWLEFNFNFDTLTEAEQIAAGLAINAQLRESSKVQSVSK